MEIEYELQSPSRIRGAWARLHRSPLVAIVLLFAVFAGPCFAILVFPEVPLMTQILGGWIFGAFFSLCAIPAQFLEL